MGKNKIPTIKADEFVEFEAQDKPESFTNFEELNMKFEVLKETVNELTEILRANNLVRNTETVAPYFDDDDVYRRLEDD